ncbi:MAG: hypothetical protein H7246_12240 [Phycisphaerae bacterium]|nr:hypothetical protein [Saprospiraceae bacterium]
MIIGINYPWLNYDWDFGIPPPGWTSRAVWINMLDADLKTFKRCNIQVVRWFILGSGMLYGQQGLAPHRAGNQWRFDQMPGIDPSILEDFRRLLQIFASHEMKLLPVLMDFKWAFPGLDRHTTDASTLKAWYGRFDTHSMTLQEARQNARQMPEGFVKGGRLDVIYDPSKSAGFFRNVLSPFLALSQEYRDTIYAWELINEPEWVTRQKGLGSIVPQHKRIPLNRILQFIRDGLTVIQNFGFVPTVGFAHARTISNWESSLYKKRRLLKETASLPETNHLGLGINQFHYYPSDISDLLIPNRFPNKQTAILGEFATKVSPVRWPELNDAHQGIHERLRLVQAKGYAAAFPWSYHAADQHTESNKNIIEAALSTLRALA